MVTKSIRVISWLNMLSVGAIANLPAIHAKILFLILYWDGSMALLSF